MVPEALREDIRAVETERWRARTSTKPVLGVFQAEKITVEKVPWYDNSAGRGLLAEARIGTLRARLVRARFTQRLDEVCTPCGRDKETTEHLVLQSQSIVPDPQTTVLPVALGFRIGGDTEERIQVDTHSVGK